MIQYTELETQIYSKKNTIINNTSEEIIKEHVLMFIKNMISKHAENITIELLLNDVS